MSKNNISITIYPTLHMKWPVSRVISILQKAVIFKLPAFIIVVLPRKWRILFHISEIFHIFNFSMVFNYLKQIEQK